VLRAASITLLLSFRGVPVLKILDKSAKGYIHVSREQILYLGGAIPKVRLTETLLKSQFCGLRLFPILLGKSLNSLLHLGLVQLL
jgi:hypothetical protein